jgi:outer membrane receptor protein involved in Fe transport
MLFLRAYPMLKARRKLLSSALCLFLLNPWAPARALSDDLQMDQLFDLVSSLSAQTPTLRPIPVSRTPGTVSVVTDRQIEELGLTSLDQVLALMPGVDSVYSPMGFAGNIRGFGGSPFQEGVQFLIDGMLYNSPDKGGSSASPGFSSFPVPVEMIKQVEVVREPMSALYGPNAFFGVVNVITKTGADLDGAGSVSARAGNRSGGRGVQRYAGLHGRSNGKMNWAAAGEFSREMGPMELNKESRIQDAKAAGKVQYGNLLFAWLNQTGRTEPYDFQGVQTQETQQAIHLAGMDYSKDLGDGVSVFTKTHFLTRRGTNCQSCHNPNYLKTTEPQDHREAFYRAFQQVRAQVTDVVPRNDITVGAEFMYDKNHMDSGVMGDPRPVARTYSGFVQDVAHLGDTVSLTVGLRQDHSQWSNAGSLFSPRALLVYSPSDRVAYRTGYTQAHRVPTYHDLHAFFIFVPVTFADIFLAGNPDLKPETIHTYSVGSDRWLSDSFLFRLNGFYSEVRNQIDRRFLSPAEVSALLPGGKLPNGEPVGPATLVAQWANNPVDAGILGGEVEMNYRPMKRLDLALSYGYKNVRFDKDPASFMGGPHAPNAPRHLLKGMVTAFPLPRLITSVTARYRYKFHAAYPIQNDVAVPGFKGSRPAQDALLVDAHARYAFARGVSLSLAGNNIFNQRPREWHLGEATDLTTGRNFSAQLSYEFGGAASP